MYNKWNMKQRDVCATLWAKKKQLLTTKDILMVILWERCRG